MSIKELYQVLNMEKNISVYLECDRFRFQNLGCLQSKYAESFKKEMNISITKCQNNKVSEPRNT